MLSVRGCCLGFFMFRWGILIADKTNPKHLTMSGREGGKKKPLKAPKKQGGDLDEDDKVRMKNT